jgi:hypothetical protein
LKVVRDDAIIEFNKNTWGRKFYVSSTDSTVVGFDPLVFSSNEFLDGYLKVEKTIPVVSTDSRGSKKLMDVEVGEDLRNKMILFPTEFKVGDAGKNETQSCTADYMNCLTNGIQLLGLGKATQNPDAPQINLSLKGFGN